MQTVTLRVDDESIDELLVKRLYEDYKSVRNTVAVIAASGDPAGVLSATQRKNLTYYKKLAKSLKRVIRYSSTDNQREAMGIKA